MTDSPAEVRVIVIWVLVVLSSLAWSGGVLSSVSERAEQGATAAALALALFLAISINWRIRLIGAAPLLFAFLLVLAALLPWAYGVASIGTLQRALRLGMVVLTAWVIAGDSEDGRVRNIACAHLLVYATLTTSFLVGALFFPGLAFEPAPGRLSGLVPPSVPNRVGEIGAVTVGMALMAGVAGWIRPLASRLLLVSGLAVVILSASRTATIALLLAIAVALLSLAARQMTARRVLIGLAVAAVVGWLVLAAPLEGWFARGQSAEELSSLTGRRNVWPLVLANQPEGISQWFGFGLGDKSIGGLPIDNGWLAAYREQGLVGVSLVGSLVVAVLIGAARLRPTPERALALFLVTFTLASSITETGISDASPYLLHLLVAALLVYGAKLQPSAQREWP